LSFIIFIKDNLRFKVKEAIFKIWANVDLIETKDIKKIKLKNN